MLYIAILITPYYINNPVNKPRIPHFPSSLPPMSVGHGQDLNHHLRRWWMWYVASLVSWEYPDSVIRCHVSGFYAIEI